MPKKVNLMDYEVAWMNPEGKEYRNSFYNRQRAGGTKPLVDNPTVPELVSDLEKHSPKSILEIGCGFGRLLKPISDHFSKIQVDGCDVSKEMLSLCPKDVHTFHFDVCTTQNIWKWDAWDTGFCRGVFMYFDGVEFQNAIETISRMVRKKILVYEWDFVCDRIKKVSNDPKFEYHVILQKEE